MTGYVFLLVASVAVASVSQLLLKVSADRPHRGFWREYGNPWTLGAYGLLFCSTLLTVAAFRGLAFKNAPVIESLGYLFVLILSRVFFREKITRRKLAGNLLIVAGVLIFYI
ncbi:MAG: EamA family transporter [Ethanoligenens sp.]|uniref:EamA family transporter n=1 Tax=Ethanoligenens sp. TaxID=2099655 RepID=UPI0039EC8BB0